MLISKCFPSKFLKVADLDGNEMVLTITHCAVEDVGLPGQQESKPVVYFEEIETGLVLNKTNSTAISMSTGSADTDDWPGHKITLYEAETTFQGKPMQCIRVKSKAPKTAARPVAAVAAPQRAAASLNAQRPTAQPQTRRAAPPEPPAGDQVTEDDIPF